MDLLDKDFLTSFVNNNNSTVSISLAASTLVVYDYALTLSAELRYMWPARWSIAKFLFFAARYFVFLDIIVNLWFHWGPLGQHPALCLTLFKVSGALNTFGIFISELVLMYRTRVIWNSDPRITLTMAIALLIICPLTTVFIYMGLQSVKFSTSLIPISGCWQPGPPGRILFGCYILVCILESFILVLTLYKGVSHYQYSKSNLSDVIYQDGIIYYFYSVGVSCLNIVIIALELRGASMIQMQRILHSMFASHLLLDIRQAAHEDKIKGAPNLCSSCGVTNTEQFYNITLPGLDTRTITHNNEPYGLNAV